MPQDYKADILNAVFESEIAKLTPEDFMSVRQRVIEYAKTAYTDYFSSGRQDTTLPQFRMQNGENNATPTE